MNSNGTLIPNQFALQFVCFATTAGNAVAFSQYMIRACDPDKYARVPGSSDPVAPFPDAMVKGIAVLCISVNVLIHIFIPKAGSKYFMIGFGIMKVVLLLLV